MLKASFVRTGRLGRCLTAQKRWFSSQLAPTSSSNEVVVSKENHDEIRKSYRWERWINDFPGELRKQAAKMRDSAIQKEVRYHDNTSAATTINFDEWRKRIRTPGVVDLIEAEYNAQDRSDYGPYVFDDMTQEAKDQLFDEGDEHAADVGFETIINGVKDTNEAINEKWREYAEDRVIDAKNWLNELYQDGEQHKARMDGQVVRSELMEMAEFPEVARYCEELAYGEPTSTRATPIFQYEHDEIFVDRRVEHEQMIADATMSRRQEEFESFKEDYEELGFTVDLEALKENILAADKEFDKDMETKFYALTGEGEYYDPSDGRYYYEETGELVPNP